MTQHNNNEKQQQERASNRLEMCLRNTLCLTDDGCMDAVVVNRWDHQRRNIET
jgi:hypothetical protein